MHTVNIHKAKTHKSRLIEQAWSHARDAGAQIPDQRKRGNHVKLVFLSLPSAEMAVARVAARVEQGGHSNSELTFARG